MEIAVWVAQALLALAFLGAGLFKILRPKERIQPSLPWVEDFSQPAIRGIGVLEVLGALGLVVPVVTGTATLLVPWAAVGLALVMVGAAATHLRREEGQAVVVNGVLLVLALVVAWARFGPYPV